MNNADAALLSAIVSIITLTIDRVIDLLKTKVMAKTNVSKGKSSSRVATTIITENVIVQDLIDEKNALIAKINKLRDEHIVIVTNLTKVEVNLEYAEQQIKQLKLENARLKTILETLQGKQ